MRKTEKFKVAGVTHYVDSIKSLARINDDYDLPNSELKDLYSDGDRIFQYEFKGLSCELVPEPDNQYDSNAVKVLINGVHVGYIKKGSCSHVKNLLNDSTCEFSVDEVCLGKYKQLYDGRIEKDEFESPHIAIKATYGENDAAQSVPASEQNTQPQKNDSPAVKKASGTTWMITGILWVVLGLVMLLLNPIIGLVCIVAAVLMIVKAFKLKKDKKE